MVQHPSSYPKVREEVLRGMAWLDENEPGWPQRINMRTLNLNSGLHCILGQLSGEVSGASYFLYLSSRGLDHEWAAAHGFIVHDPWAEPEEVLTKTEALEKEWRRVLDARRAAS